MSNETKTKDIFVAWTNDDLTEGRGARIPYCVCELESTARRLGKGKSVQGGDCMIEKRQAYFIDGHWMTPGIIHAPSKRDREVQEMVDEARSKGLSEKTISALGAWK